MRSRPGKIVCVGRNYAAHARELGNEVPARPLLFLKPASAVVPSGQPILLPSQSRRVEHEAEIGVVIGGRCRDVAEAAGYVPLNDVTARDLQRLDGQWTRAKGFDTFCPVGELVSADAVDWRTIVVSCTVNGEVRQHDSADHMVFGVPFLVAYISAIMTLEPGDIIATGTPEGVGPIVDGDSVRVELTGLAHVENPVYRRNAESS